MARPRKSVNITWLGEDDLEHEMPDGRHIPGYSENEGVPQRTTWNGIEFKKGEPVAVTHKGMIEKAKGNRFFSVEESNED